MGRGENWQVSDSQDEEKEVWDKGTEQGGEWQDEAKDRGEIGDC